MSRILIACEFSGIVREEFKKIGWDAWSCDILPTEIPGQHIQDDVLKHLNEGWDMMIAHPPCTYLSYAATKSWNDKGRIWKRIDALTFFGRLYDADIPRICVENPAGCASPTIAKFSQIIQPWQFGDEESKRTWLWLKNLPLLKATKIVKPKIYGYYKRGKKKGMPIYGNNYLKFSEDRGHIRSKTYQGIAQAMAEQWGKIDGD